MAGDGTDIDDATDGCMYAGDEFSRGHQHRAYIDTQNPINLLFG